MTVGFVAYGDCTMCPATWVGVYLTERCPRPDPKQVYRERGICRACVERMADTFDRTLEGASQ
jgi:hypothetical protein